MKDLISVVINVYNGEKYITKCLESVINQTYINLEIIIVNDGSNDKTLEICNSYKDKRIRIINQKNKGLSLSRNVGIDNANGKYLFFVDADDFIESDTIEYFYKICIEKNVDISTSAPIETYDYDFKINYNKKEIVKVISNLDYLKKILLSKDRAGTIWNKLIKKELFESLRFEDRVINDVALVYKLILKTEKIAFSNQKKYYYYRHSSSILGQKKPEHSIDLFKASVERYDYLKKLYPKMIENEVCLDYIIMSLYLQDNEKVQSFLNEQKAYEIFKEKFSLKILFTNLRFREKIKTILFLTNPRLCKGMVEKYIKLKKEEKR